MKIFVLNTGGTLGMIGKPLRPAKSGRQLLRGLRISSDIEVKIEDEPTLKDSTNISHEDRRRIAYAIQEEYKNCDAFLVLHGTDTLERTTAYLSMVFKRSLQKPVFVTGAQSPRDISGSDAIVQLENSFRMLSAFHRNDAVGVYSLSLGDVWHGARLKKRNESNPNSFYTPGLAPVAYAWAEIQFNAGLRKKDSGLAVDGLTVEADLEEMVAPGIVVSADTPPWLLMTQIKSKYPWKGFLLFCEGSGQITNREWNDPVTHKKYSWVDVIAEATSKGIYVGVVSPFEDGTVNLDAYELGAQVKEAGAIGMASLVPAMADIKFRQALWRFPNDPRAIARYCQTDIIGELLVRTANIK